MKSLFSKKFEEFRNRKGSRRAQIQFHMQLLLDEINETGDLAERKALQQEYQRYQVMLQKERSMIFVSPDALMQAGVSLVGLLVILNYEKFDVLRTQALPIVMRGIGRTSGNGK